jgi:hypothetical protein
MSGPWIQSHLPAVLSFLGAVIGALISGYIAWRQASKTIRFQRKKWLFDRVVNTCVQTIDYLIDGYPPGTIEHKLHDETVTLWDCEDFNGRMSSLKHVSARLTELIFFRRHFFPEVTEDLEEKRKAFDNAIKQVRESVPIIYGSGTNGKAKSGHPAGDVRDKIKQAQDAVERYLEQVSGVRD